MSWVSDVAYAALLQHLACTAYASEVARVWGDEITATRVAFRATPLVPTDLWRTWVPEMTAATGRSRARVLVTTAATTAARPPLLSVCRRACSPPPTSTKVWSRTGRTDRPCRRRRPVGGLRAEVRADRLDGDAVAAVLAGVGLGDGARVRPAGLSARQVETLRLVARGLSNRRIADELGISPRTAEHHVQNV